ncbi:response regulator [Mariniflexile litorale]|uniref:histidine kinase n=1 Tax=Mariniflexile litorale TaxID=3045158 RepID=A0AAU7ECF9_9FLAO|nr:response regulator [Mariniflexile sp. KMM 9835]MDQ8213385.1 response regulator [Mariniflexile sp. KMM 9835]
MIKKIQLDLIIAITTFLVLITLIISVYLISINKYYAVIKEDLFHTGKLISKEFNKIIHSDISKLENIKSRLEFTNGSYFKNWEHDADLILKQNNTFKFIEWIDSLMVIKKISPSKGNEQALNLDISKLDYRKNEWINHSKSGKTNITSWLKLTQSGNAFLVDVPVYFNKVFQGSITAGMNFNGNFDRLVNYLEDEYAVELYDDTGNLFYEANNTIKLKTKRHIVYTNNIQIDELEAQAWHLKIYPTEKLLMAEGKIVINIALIIGIFLAFIVSSLIYFYLRARKGTKHAEESNLSLVKLNDQLNKEKDRANKASQAKTDFLSNMSHEIRTPLHAIIGFIELLKDAELSDTHQEYVDLMDKSSNNLLNLVNDILEIDKIESGKTELEKLVFNPIKEIKELAEVNQFLFLKKNLYLKTNFENTLDLTVIGDLYKLIQIVNNILKNALKFTKEGGVTITSSETVIENKLKLIISIEDTGIGIPENKLNTIFNRFTQIENSVKKQHEGSGLGLAISENLVSIMGGEISVQSKHQVGSKFTMSFLFDITETDENVKYTKNDKTIKTTGINVLIVDDNNLNIIVLKKILENIGIESDTAENGKIALEKVNKKAYQLIFMDIHMPEMDGWEATRIIRQSDKHVIIFGLSANVTTEAINKAIENGMNNYLTKPFKKQHLYKLLQFHFNNSEE